MDLCLSCPGGIFFIKVFFRLQNNTTVDEWMLRKLSRIMAERAKSQSIASSKIFFFLTFINPISLIVRPLFIFQDFKSE